MEKKTRGRPPEITGDTLVRLCCKGKVRRLQSRSLRRLVANYLFEHGGAATIGEIEDALQLDVKSTVQDLRRGGWVEF